jgi:GTP cyclohydrolase I
MNDRRVIDERAGDGGPPPVPAAVTERAESLVRELLALLGEDPDREGLVRTPERVARAYGFLTEGYRKDVDELFNDAYFDEEYDEMVLVKDIEFYSLCEHHLLPFFGKVHVAYLPRRKIVGLSKIPRLVDLFARRLQIQERLTKEIAEMMMEHSTMTTSHMLGNFRDHQPTRLEFMNLIACQGA